MSSITKLHASLALLAYASLSIAALLALLCCLQDRALRRRHLQPLLGATALLALAFFGSKLVLEMLLQKA